MKDFFLLEIALSYVLHEASYWRLILIECLRYWILHALALSCRPRGRVHSVNNLGGLYGSENRVPQSEYPMYVNFPYNSKDNKNTIYLVTAMTHAIALEAGQYSQGALKPITPVQLIANIVIYLKKDTLSFYHLTCICHPACIFHHYWEIGISRPIYPPPPPSKQYTTVRGLLSVNVLLAMLITVTLFSSH